MPAKFIVFREDTWFAPMAEHAMYQHLTEAFVAEFQLIRDWADAEIPEGWPVIVMHETGQVESRDYVHPENAVYVLGKTGQALLQAVSPYDDVLRIHSPFAQELWGIQVAAIVLRDRQAAS